MLGYRNSSEKDSYSSDVKLLESHGNDDHVVDAVCDDRDDGMGCHIIDDVDTDDSDNSDYVSNDGSDDRQHKQYICNYILCSTGVIIHELPRLLGETSYHHD